MDENILFIEDDDDDVFLIQRACKTAGIDEPQGYLPNGKAAMDYFSSVAHSLPKLIFLDLNMPLMGGLAFLGWLRGQPTLLNIPVVILTTSENPKDLTAAYRAGANAYMVKPNAVSRYAEMLGCAITFWTNYNRTAVSPSK